MVLVSWKTWLSQNIFCSLICNIFSPARSASNLYLMLCFFLFFNCQLQLIMLAGSNKLVFLTIISPPWQQARSRSTPCYSSCYSISCLPMLVHRVSTRRWNHQHRLAILLLDNEMYLACTSVGHLPTSNPSWTPHYHGTPCKGNNIANCRHHLSLSTSIVQHFFLLVNWNHQNRSGQSPVIKSLTIWS
jgi:hypothetical protein